MTRQLVLVHGRAQEKKDAKALKAQWLDSLDKGLKKSGLTLPIAEGDVRFPYYGDTLYQISSGTPIEGAAEIVVRGPAADRAREEFLRAVLLDVKEQTGISDQQLDAELSAQVVERGPLNWEWMQGILRAIDRKVPGGSSRSIALATYDVYAYLTNPAIRKKIDDGVLKAVTPGRETVMVAHSLGTVVSYNLLRQQGPQLGWTIPTFITVGSPLGVTKIRETMKSFSTIRCPECVGSWFNAMDERDVVALYPLEPKHFPLNPDKPAITNKRDVKNHTANRHGIEGYLEDAEVARRIHDALVT
jgi:hypothetical protein